MGRTLKRRRLEARTDYRSRIELLKSGKPRLVVRKTNRYLIAQIVLSENAQDRVVLGASSKMLLQKGWPETASGSLKSLGAAYLTGTIIALNADGKFKDLILDIGMQRSLPKSRLYAVVKGAIDKGMKINCSKEMLPSDEEIAKNKKTLSLFQKLKGEIKNG